MAYLRTAAFAVISLGLVAGCSSKPPPAPSDAGFNALQEVHGLLHASVDRAGHPPSKVSDLERHHNMFPNGYAAVKSGDVVVLWGAPIQDEGDIGKNETPLAYEKNVPTAGGYVLLSAGTVKKMTADEFMAAAPKGAKK